MSAIDRLRGLSDDVAIKAPCRMATTANVVLNGLQTIDGVVQAAGDRVLVWHQTDAKTNGIYACDTGDWSRDVDFSGPGDLTEGTLVLVNHGTLYGSTIFQLTTVSPVIGTSNLTFALTGAAALALASAFWQAMLPLTTAAASRTALGVPSNAEAILQSMIDAEGDLIIGTAPDTAARLAPGTVGQLLTMVAGRPAWAAASAVAPTKGTIFGWTYGNNVGDATNDIDIAAGGGADGTGAVSIVGAASTKQSDALWAVGSAAGALDTGAVGNNGYYIWAIKRSDTGVVDYLFSLSATAPDMTRPGAAYDYKRLFGYFLRAGGAIVTCHTYETEGGGLELIWDTPTLDVNLAGTLTTARRTDAVKVPLLFSTTAILHITMNDASAVQRAIVYCPDQSDGTPSGTAAPLYNFTTDNTGGSEGRSMDVRTSAAGLIAARSNLATVDLYAVSTQGFRWSRR